MVEEPSVEETIEILRGIKERYEQHHRLEITDEALKAAAELAARYVPDRFLPDKAIDLVDEAASRVRMQRRHAPPLKEVMRGLEAVQNEKEAAIRRQQYELAAEYRDHEAKLREKLEKLESGWQTEQGNEKPVVDRGGHRPGRRDVDRHPGDADRRGGVGPPAQDGGARSTSGSRARTRRSRPSPRRSAARAPA